MRIQTRILILSVVMSFASMLALLGANSMLFNRLGGEFRSKPIPEMRAGETIFEAGELLNGGDAAAGNWSKLESTLSERGYRLYIRTPDGKEPIPPESGQTAEYLRNIKPRGNSLALFSGNRAVMAAGRRVAANDGEYTVVAYFTMAPDEDEVRAFRGFRNTFLQVGFVVLVTILLLSLLFTRALVGKIMTPVGKMIAGARRIESGNLSVPIDYTSRDEFGTLCDAFNRMQTHLFLEREKNAAHERARTEMFADISHDLRTPLTSVKGFIKGVIDGVADTPEKRSKYLSIAYKKACDIDTMLNQVSFFSKLETGSLPISTVRTELADYIDHFTRDSYEDFDIHVGQDIPPGTRIYADIDPDNMKRVLYNLLENAVKYAKADPLCVTIGLGEEGGRVGVAGVGGGAGVVDRDGGDANVGDVNVGKAGGNGSGNIGGGNGSGSGGGCKVAGQAVIRFHDNGNGVPEDKLPYIFDRFYRADEARSKRNNEGSGLGLYIVRHLVEAQGGTVEAINQDGFTVIIRLNKL